MSPRQQRQALTAKDVMQRNVVSVDPMMTVPEVVQCFLDRQITGAPVVDEEDKLVGVISQTDLLRHQRRGAPAGAQKPSYYQQANGEVLVSHLKIDASATARVRDLMTPVTFMTEEETPLREVPRFMLERHVHRIIVTRQGKLAGIITSMDLLRALLDGGGAAEPNRKKKAHPPLRNPDEHSTPA